MLGGGVDHHVGAELERLLAQRRGEDVVDEHLGAGGMGDLRHRGDVDQVERRVGRRLQEHRPGVRPHRRLPGREVAAFDEGGGDAVARQDGAEDDEAGAEQRPAGHDMVAAAQMAEQGGEHARHAAGGDVAALRPFQQGQARLQHLQRRVAVAGIDEAGLVAGEARLGRRRAVIDEARGQEDRLGGLAIGRSSGAAADQHGLGAEFVFAGGFVSIHLTSSSTRPGGGACGTCAQPTF